MRTILTDPTMPAYVDPPVTLLTALDRAESREPLSKDDAAVLMSAHGDELTRLLAIAATLRDEGLRTRGRPGLVTYSRKVFVPVTTLCRDRCHYCVFVDTPGQLLKQGKAPYLSPDQVLATARAGAAAGCKEVLFTLGDRPEDRWPVAAQWLHEHGYASTIDYLRELGELVLTETGLLPHMNPGVMTWREMQVLRPVSPSMGMMLETVATRLWSEPGETHFGSPDKDPAVRLRSLADAGRARVPFSTGVLLGIGETVSERAAALFALRALHEQFGNIQEVIVQNLRVKPATAMQNHRDLALDDYVASIAVARLVMGPTMTIQAPPNLSEPADLGLLLAAGVDDWGGVSPLTPDHVNPERPWPHLDTLAQLTADSGFTLTERLTAHPEYVRNAEVWIAPELRPAVVRWANPTTGLAQVTSPTAPPEPATTVPRPLGSETLGLLRRLENDPAGLRPTDYEAALRLRGPALTALANIADGVRTEAVGEVMTFVANRNLDSTLFRTAVRRPSLEDARLAELAAEAWSRGATEICAQGAPPMTAGPHAFTDLVRVIHTAAPRLHIHAFRPPELLTGAQRAGLSLNEHLQTLREAGLNSVPGTVALVFDDRVRATLTGGATVTTNVWESTIRAAHLSGLTSTSTLVYGHIETPAQIVAHMLRLRRIQQDTGGFTEFIPMPYSPTGPHDPFGQGPDLATSIAVHAVARLLLHGSIAHIQVAWTKVGLSEAEQILRAGADDAGGLLMGGGIEPLAGAEAGRELALSDVTRLATALGRRLQQRTTGYAIPSSERIATLATKHRPAGPLVHATVRPAREQGAVR